MKEGRDWQYIPAMPEKVSMKQEVMMIIHATIYIVESLRINHE